MQPITSFFYFKIFFMLFSIATTFQGHELVEAETNYTVWENSSSGGYYCQVKDFEGHVFYTESSPTLGIGYINEDNTVVEVFSIAGSSISLVKYCDLLTGTVSREYITPIFVEDGIVAYYEYDAGNHVPILFIGEIFSDSILAEYTLDDFSPVATPHLGTVEIIKRNETVIFTYLSGEDHIPKTVEISLSE